MSAFAVLLTMFLAQLAYAGVIDWVPSAPLPADGVTPSVVYLYGAGLGDSPKIKVKSDDGKVSAVESVGGGLVRFSFVPGSVTAPKDAALKVSVSGQELTVGVPVVPGFAGSVELTFDPPILSSTGTATVKLRPSGTSPVSLDGRRFLLQASVGTVDVPASTGNGEWVARYTPPKGLTNPVAVVFSAADAAAPETVYGRAILPISVRKTVSFPATPGAKLTLNVGTRSFGPFTASAKGQVSFDVDLDPREREGRLVGVNPDTAKVDQVVSLPLVVGSQVMFQPLPGNVPPGTKVPVRLAVVDEVGADRIDLAVEIKASVGEISASYREGTVYTATWTAPATGGDVRFTGTATGGEGSTKVSLTGTASLRVSPGAPTVSLTADPSLLAATTTTLTLTARVKDSAGTAVLGKIPALSAEGGVASGTAKDNKDGTYTLTVKRNTGASELRLFAMPDYEASKLTPARIVAWPASSGIKPGAATTLTMLVLDQHGVPVPDVEVKLAVPVGDATLTPVVRTNTRGLARVALKAGGQAGLVAVRLNAPGVVGGAAVLISDPTGALPEGGSDADRALLDRWRAVVPALVVGEVAPAPVVATPSATSVGGGVVTGTSGSTTTTSVPGVPGTSAPKSKSTSDGPRAIVGVGLLDVRGSYSQTSDAGALLLGAAEYSTPGIGFIGLQADVVWWALNQDWGGVAVDARAAAALEVFEVVGDKYSKIRPDIIVGGRYRYPLGPASLQAGLGVHYTTLSAFRYTTDDLDATEALGLGLPGGRLMIGAGLDLEKVGAAIEIAETFVPYPCDLHLGGHVEVVVADPVAVRAGAAYDLRSYKVEADDGDGNAEIDYKNLSVLVGAAFRF